MSQLFSGPLGLSLALGILGVVLISGVAAVMTSSKKRLDPVAKFKKAANATTSGSVETNKLRKSDSRKFKALERYASFLEPEDAKELSAARENLTRAGYSGKNAVRDFHAIQFILAMSGMLLPLSYLTLIAPDAVESIGLMVMIIMGPMVIGYYGPRTWVNSRAERRKEEIQSGFPDALDMLLICVEAGQSLDQGLQRVSREMRSAYPALGEELAIVGENVKAGRERTEVLKEMAQRCDVPDIASFVAVMVQAASYGTSISDALRVFSAEMRDKRVMRAEEKANLLPTKMTLGTMLFTVPPLLIILIGPSVIGIISDLGGGMNFGGM